MIGPDLYFFLSPKQSHNPFPPSPLAPIRRAMMLTPRASKKPKVAHYHCHDDGTTTTTLKLEHQIEGLRVELEAQARHISDLEAAAAQHAAIRADLESHLDRNALVCEGYVRSDELLRSKLQEAEERANNTTARSSELESHAQRLEGQANELKSAADASAAFISSIMPRDGGDAITVPRHVQEVCSVAQYSKWKWLRSKVFTDLRLSLEDNRDYCRLFEENGDEDLRRVMTTMEADHAFAPVLEAHLAPWIARIAVEMRLTAPWSLDHADAGVASKTWFVRDNAGHLVQDNAAGFVCAMDKLNHIFTSFQSHVPTKQCLDEGRMVRTLATMCARALCAMRRHGHGQLLERARTEVAAALASVYAAGAA